MTNDEAISILMAQYLNPSASENKGVDLTYNEAVLMAIYALNSQIEKDFETVDNVRVSKQLATFLKPYTGCPRGPMGPSGNTSAVEILRNAEKYVIAGPDDRFVCVPEWDYEACLKALEKHEAEKGCKYCRDGEVIALDACSAVRIEGNGRSYVIGGGEWESEINYCPMCGRQLRHPPKEAPDV